MPLLHSIDIWHLVWHQGLRLHLVNLVKYLLA